MIGLCGGKSLGYIWDDNIAPLNRVISSGELWSDFLYLVSFCTVCPYFNESPVRVTTGFGSLFDVPDFSLHVGRYVVSSCWCKVWISPHFVLQWMVWMEKWDWFVWQLFFSVNLNIEFTHCLTTQSQMFTLLIYCARIMLVSIRLVCA